jgi:hypothetical protein
VSPANYVGNGSTLYGARRAATADKPRKGSRHLGFPSSSVIGSLAHCCGGCVGEVLLESVPDELGLIVLESDPDRERPMYSLLSR